MKFRKTLLIPLIILMLTSFASFVNARDSKIINIGIVIDGPSVIGDEILVLVQHEILALTKNEFNVRFPKDKMIIADWTLEANKRGISRLLKDDDVDVLLTLGVISTSDVIHRGPLSKPTIATLVVDSKIQNSPHKGNASGIKNLCYTAIASDFEKIIQDGKKHVNAKFITVITNKTIDIAIPNLSKHLKDNLKDLGAEVELLTLSESIEETLNQINPKTDVVLVAHQTFLSIEDKMQIINGLIDRKLSSFAMAGKSDVELGFLMSTGQDEIDIKRLARRIALNLQSVLLGAKPSELPIFFTKKKQLTINMETARKIGFSPTFEMLENALLINNDFKIAESLSIFDAVDKSIDTNLNLAAKGKEVVAGMQDVKKAWAKLLPQLNLSNSYAIIDEDRATASGGLMPERTASATVVFDQVLFADDTFANLFIKKETQRILESTRDELELDIIQATTVAYLNVLRAQRIEAIQMNSLELSRSNLHTAQIRKNLGQSSSADIYRWESEIANNQKDILTAAANLMNDQLSLNLLLHQPLEDDYNFDDVGMDNSEMFLTEDFAFFIENPLTFQLLRNFMVEETISIAPEVSQIESLIKVRKRVLQSSKRDFWVPEVSFQAMVTDNYHRDGAGVTTTSTKNDQDVTGIFKVTYPLFKGGDKFASVKQAQTELEQLKIQLDALKEQISQDIRSSMHGVGRSYSSIKWSNKSAQAARKNLELIQNAYSEGAKDITVLLDAQNASLNANQVAENAIYDFLIDYFKFQRAIRKFYFRESNEEKEKIMARLIQYFKANGVDL